MIKIMKKKKRPEIWNIKKATSRLNIIGRDYFIYRLMDVIRFEFIQKKGKNC